MITAGGYTTETAVSAIEPAPSHPGWGAAERLRPFDGLWRRRTWLLMFSSFGSTGERRSWPMPSRSGGCSSPIPKAAGPFFCDDRRVLSV